MDFFKEPDKSRNVTLATSKISMLRVVFHSLKYSGQLCQDPKTKLRINCGWFSQFKIFHANYVKIQKRISRIHCDCAHHFPHGGTSGYLVIEA